MQLSECAYKAMPRALWPRYVPNYTRSQLISLLVGGAHTNSKIEVFVASSALILASSGL